MGKAATTIDEFLAAMPEDQRAALDDLRAKIRAVAPDATEGVAYGVPAFRLGGRPLVSFGGGKEHCSFYVQDLAVIGDLADAIAAAGLTWNGGTIRFPASGRIPAELVEWVIAARRAQLEGSRRS